MPDQDDRQFWDVLSGGTHLAHPSATAVNVKDGKFLAVGDVNDLVEGYSGATVDESFARQAILPGLIDPHMISSSQ